MAFSSSKPNATAKEFAAIEAHTLLEALPDGMVVTDTSGQIVMVNKQTEEMFGWPRDELIGRPVEVLIPERLRAEHTRRRAQYQVAPHARPMGAELDLVGLRHDGTEFPVEISLSPIATAHGTLVTSAVRDITQRRATEAQFRGLLESAPDAMVIVDNDGDISLINSQAEHLFGYERAELLGKPIEVLVPERLRDVHPNHRAAYYDAPQVRPMGAGLDLHARRKDGTEVPVEISLSPVQTPEGPLVIAAIRDVTERKRAESLSARARQHEAVVELGQLALAGAPLARLLRRAVTLAAVTLGVPYVSVLELVGDDELVLREAYGLSDDLLGQTVTDLHSMSQPARALVARAPAITGDATTLPYLRDHGVVTGASVPILGAEAPFGVIGAHDREARELTRDDLHFLQSVANLLGAAAVRERAERELRESRQRLQAILDNSPAIIYIKDREGRYVLVNRRFEAIFGVSADDVGELTDFDLFPADVAATLSANDERVLETGEPIEVEEVKEHGGMTRTYISLKFPLRDATGRPSAVCGISTDITERVRAQADRDALEAQVHQAQRLESIGQLAGGIAHDFNNLLAVIRNYTGFVMEDLPETSSSRDDLDQIRRATEMAATLTRQLLIFSRREIARPEVLDLNVIVRDTERLLRRTLGEHIELRTDLADELSPVEMDPGQAEQLLVNLALNARDAMPAGGSLRIATRHVAAENGLLARVSLTVTDTGVGMSAEVAQRAFEPFFTTKPKGEGTGLGLATAYGVVSRAGGTIELESTPGSGTVVSILLPESSAPARETVVGHQDASPEGHGETVLVVEDDEHVRAVVVRILEDHGYEVLTAANAADALRRRDAHEGHIDLLLTDVVMPGASGRELAEEMTGDDPGIKVVFMTGYTDDELLRVQGRLATASILSKPFDSSQLLRRLQQQLAS